VQVVVGEKLLAQSWVKTTFPGAETVAVTRDNLTANTLKKGISVVLRGDLLEDLKTKDSNSARRRVISNATKAVEYAKNGYFKDAFKTMGKIYNYSQNVSDKKKSLRSLKILLDKQSQFKSGKLIGLYNLILSEHIAELSGLRGGAAKTFYEGVDYEHFAAAVKNLYEVGEHRTIHKAKGEEFDTVLVVVDNDSTGNFDERVNLKFILDADLENNEEHRIMYVALSRAQNNLIINIPSLSTAIEATLTARNLSVIRL